MTPTSSARTTRTLPCPNPGDPPADSAPTPIPTPQGTVDVSTQQLSATSVLPPGDTFAGAYVVTSANGAYFFPQNAVVTQSNGQLIVRSYDSLWVYPSSAVSVRTLASTSALSQAALPAESDPTVASIATSSARPAAPAGDICADCSQAVLQGIAGAGIATDSSPTVVAEAAAPSSSMTCGAGAACAPYPNDAYDPAQITDYTQSANSAATCRLGGYVYSDASGACIPSTTPGLSSALRSAMSAKRHVRYRSATSGPIRVLDYVHSYWGHWTSLVTSDPAMNQILDANTYYFDLTGLTVNQHFDGLWFGSSNRITMTTRPTTMWPSYSQIIFYYHHGMRLAEADAAWARLTW